MLKLACTLLNLANIFFLSSTTAMFYPLPEDRDLLEKVRKDMVGGGTSLVFTRKTVVGKTKNDFHRMFANQSYVLMVVNSIHTPMHTGLYTCWELDVSLQRSKPRSNEARCFEHMVVAYSQNSRPDCKIEISHNKNSEEK